MNCIKKAMFLTLFLSAFSLLMLGYGLMFNMVTIRNVGRIKTIRVEVDTDFIDWGTLSPDSYATRLINVRSVGNTNVTLLLNASDWNPENASQFLSLSWNYSNQILEPYQWIPIELTLTVSANITGIKNFSFDIWIIAQEI